MKRSQFFLLFLVLALPRAYGQEPAGEDPDPARFATEIEAFEQADHQDPVEPGGILFVGSSSIRMWESLQDDFPGLPVLNRGFGGSHFSDLLHYFDRIVIPYRPSTILVYEGDNDLWDGKSPERVLNDFRTFVERVHTAFPSTRIGFISIKPSPSRWELAAQIRRANDLVRQATERDARLLYIDVFAPMLGPDGTPRQELFLEDMLHMNSAGYKIWRSTIAPTIATP